MGKIRLIEPVYKVTPNGLMKVGYKVTETITNKNGDIIRHQVVRSKMYK